MPVRTRLCALVATVALAAPAFATVSAPAGAAPAPPPGWPEESSQVILDWERILMQTVYPVTPIPTGVPLLGFTSVAMHDAVSASLAAPGSSETAAAARAAHDVLVHYFPLSAAALDAHLAASLADVPDAAARTAGELIGSAAASAMLASRVGDGYLDLSILYTLIPGIGTWRPAPVMLAPWLGSLRPLVLDRPIRVNGPDPLHSGAYANDYKEVKRLGGSVASGTDRTEAQTSTALFFNGNSATMVGDALVRYLEAGEQDLSLSQTALLFARMHASMTDSLIQTWQLKRDVGFWRPVEAIAGAALDDNDRTAPKAGWAPLLNTPPYSEYVSGHASLTGPAAEVIRRTLGDRAQLELISPFSPTHRTYPTLTMLEDDAFHARIWGGLHFRDAMVDGYRIGHLTARRVMVALD